MSVLVNLGCRIFIDPQASLAMERKINMVCICDNFHSNSKLIMGLGTTLFGKYETDPGTTSWGPVADGDVYGRNLKRQNWDNKIKIIINKIGKS